MEGETYNCPSCGAPVPAGYIDFKSRRATCPFCGNAIVFRRKTINSSGGVSHNVELAIREFMQGNMVSSRRHAEDVLSVAVDNLPSLFIVAYIEGFVNATRTRIHLDRLFYETVPSVEADDEEISMWLPMLQKSVTHLGDYEGPILTLVKNMCPPKEAAEFMDGFSPYLLVRRSSTVFFTNEVKNGYLDITKKGMAPKTWFALLSSLEKNPDSPIPGATYYLTTKTKLFHDEYLLPVGEILSAIPEETLRRKFLAVYAKTKAVIESHI